VAERLGWEADVADVLDQHRAVPFDDDE